MATVDVHLAFPGDDEFPVVRLPGVPRIGERLNSQGHGHDGFWRVADVEWNTDNGTVLLDLKPDDAP